MSFRENRVDVAFDNGRDLFEADAKKILGGLNLGQFREQIFIPPINTDKKSGEEVGR